MLPILQLTARIELVEAMHTCQTRMASMVVFGHQWSPGKPLQTDHSIGAAYFAGLNFGYSSAIPVSRIA